MRLQQINRSDPEKVFAIFYSLAGTSKDYVVCLDTTSLADGISVIQPTTAGLEAVAGIVDADIAALSYGLVQIYGYRASSLCKTVNSSDSSYAAGVPMVAVNGANYLNSGTGHQYFVVLESVASSSATGTISKKIHIRAM